MLNFYISYSYKKIYYMLINYKFRKKYKKLESVNQIMFLKGNAKLLQL